MEESQRTICGERLGVKAKKPQLVQSALLFFFLALLCRRIFVFGVPSRCGASADLPRLIPVCDQLLIFPLQFAVACVGLKYESVQRLA